MSNKKSDDKKDTLFSSPRDTSPFSFNSDVAEVFPDMIQRSVPGYPVILSQIEKLAARYMPPGSRGYDLGCSLGAASLAMSKGANHQQSLVFGVDNSEPMLLRCQQHIDAFKHVTPIELHLADIQAFEIESAAMAVLNFTLQFVSQSQRRELLQNIYNGMNEDGLLLISEKIQFDDSNINTLMIDLHHEFKRDNGYSDLEISQKRNALENVLVPETMDAHIQRLKAIGFRHVTCWLQQFNFVSFIAIK